MREPVRDKPFGEEWKAKGYVEMTPEEKAKAREEQLKQRREIQASLGKPTPTPTKTVDPASRAGRLLSLAQEGYALERKLRVGASERFYERIGYPQYAGVYSPFSIPKGYQVAGITETKEGLAVTLQPKPEPKGLAEWLVGITIERPRHKLFDIILGPPKTPVAYVSYIRGKPVIVRPLATIAGLVASVEAPAYTIGRLVGLPTPRPPPTLTGGLIGKGLEAGFGWKSTELERTVEYGPAYAAGTIFGDVFLSYLIGKGAGKLAAPVKRKTVSWLTKKYVEKGPVAWKGLKERVVMRITGLKPYSPRGEVVLPSITGPVGLKELKAQEIAWELTQTSRTSGIWIRNVGLAPAKTKVLPHLISRGGEISIGYLGLLPYVTQTQVTRMGIIPYVPKVVVATGKKGLAHLVLGFGLVTIPKLKPKVKREERLILIPKVWQPTLAFEREKFRPLTVERLTPRKRERKAPILKLPTLPSQIPTQTPTPTQEAVPKTIQVTPQLPKTIQVPTIPTPTIPTLETPTPFTPYHRPRGGRDVSGLPRGLFGKWFLRTHPIKTPQQMLETFQGRKKRRKKRKRKRKR